MKLSSAANSLILAPRGLRYGQMHLAAARDLRDTYRMSASAPLKHADAKALRKAALAYPDTVEDFPWGHSAFKVAGKKAFMFLSATEDGGFSFSLKLPFRNEEALKMKGAEPTGYGMAKSGWVTFAYGPKAKAPMGKLEDYLDESWRAVAPKKMSEAFAPPQAKKKRSKA